MNKTGFGFLRLPRKADESIDYDILNPLVDRFLALGGTYFDTAYTYLDGLSEEAIRLSLVQRHPRDSFRLADKLPSYAVKEPAQCQVYFDQQLARCGVEYFDVYLLHGLNGENYRIAAQTEQFPFLQSLKERGLARRIGFSYHDSPELLDRILTEHPEVDYVQLQINYLDWDSVTIQARRCYEVAQAHGKTVLVMEPVKGGTLANVPEQVAKYLPQGSPAKAAIRFATDLEQVEIVLSGMNAMEQVQDNLQPMAPLKDWERDNFSLAARLLRSQVTVACTGCSYCIRSCPQRIPIPQYFAIYNDYCRSPSEGWKMQYAYDALASTRAKASSCLGCHECEKRCPQNLPIPQYLQALSQVLEA